MVKLVIGSKEIEFSNQHLLVMIGAISAERDFFSSAIERAIIEEDYRYAARATEFMKMLTPLLNSIIEVSDAEFTTAENEELTAWIRSL
jgi:hypothetical protein